VSCEFIKINSLQVKN